MPVYVMCCPTCGRAARTLVLEGCKTPGEWFCSHCAMAHPWGAPNEIERHPWESAQSAGCLCCGPGQGARFTCSSAG
jgi:hypothetical protein